MLRSVVAVSLGFVLAGCSESVEGEEQRQACSQGVDITDVGGCPDGYGNYSSKLGQCFRSYEVGCACLGCKGDRCYDDVEDMAPNNFWCTD